LRLTHKEHKHWLFKVQILHLKNHGFSDCNQGAEITLKPARLSGFMVTENERPLPDSWILKSCAPQCIGSCLQSFRECGLQVSKNILFLFKGGGFHWIMSVKVF